jgi:PilZ domain
MWAECEVTLGNRYEPRAATHLTVTVSGVDRNGNPFKQTAYAHNVSRRGACLDGIGCLRGPGETIEVEYRRKKGRFSVIWVGLPGTPEDAHIGIRNLDRNQDIWKLDLPKPAPDTFGLAGVEVGPHPQPSSSARSVDFDISDEQHSAPPNAFGQHNRESYPARDRRRYRRYAIDGSAAFQRKGTDMHTWGKLSDLSRGGCYVETYVPFPAGTELEMTLDVGGVRVLVDGIVTVVYPLLGMGIEFTKVGDEYRQALEQLTAPRWK